MRSAEAICSRLVTLNGLDTFVSVCNAMSDVHGMCDEHTSSIPSRMCLAKLLAALVHRLRFWIEVDLSPRASGSNLNFWGRRALISMFFPLIVSSGLPQLNMKRRCRRCSFLPSRHQEGIQNLSRWFVIWTSDLCTPKHGCQHQASCR